MQRPDYGLDAPGVVRNLALCGAAGLGVYILTATGVLPDSLSLAGGSVRIAYASAALTAGASTLATSLYMIWSSEIGKIRDRESLLDQHNWTGTERVLDIGCGRGLLLLGSARRLTTGHATGIDIWQTEDLAGNHPSATRENARRESVVNRISIETADMRSLPFRNATFDVVVSRAAVHNIYDAAGRAQAIAEICRVLNPGGTILLDDIRHAGEYVELFRKAGYTSIRRLNSRVISALWGFVTFGSYCPVRLRIERAAGHQSVSAG